jgi:hypothetical protein
MDLKTGSSVDKGLLLSNSHQKPGWDFVLPQRLETPVSKKQGALLGGNGLLSGVPNPSGTFMGGYPNRLPIKEPIFPVSSCEPVVWIDDDRAICDSSLSLNLLTFTSLLQFTADHRSATETKLLPATDRSNFSPVVSPNGTEMVFLSFRAGEYAVYRMSLTPGANPTKVADLPAVKSVLQAPVLIEWR